MALGWDLVVLLVSDKTSISVVLGMNSTHKAITSTHNFCTVSIAKLLILNTVFLRQIHSVIMTEYISKDMIVVIDI